MSQIHWTYEGNARKIFVDYIRRFLKYAGPWVNKDIAIIDLGQDETGAVFQTFEEEAEKYPIVTVSSANGRYMPMGLNDQIDNFYDVALPLGNRSLQWANFSTNTPIAFQLPTNVTGSFSSLALNMVWNESGGITDDINVNVYSNYFSPTSSVLISSGTIPSFDALHISQYICQLNPHFTLSPGSNYWVEMTPSQGSTYKIAVDPGVINLGYAFISYQNSVPSGSILNGSISGGLRYSPVFRLGGAQEFTINVKVSAKNSINKAQNIVDLLEIAIKLAQYGNLSRKSLNATKIDLSQLIPNGVSYFTSQGISVKGISKSQIDNRRRGDNDNIFTITLGVDIRTEFFYDADELLIKDIFVELNQTVENGPPTPPIPISTSDYLFALVSDTSGNNFVIVSLDVTDKTSPIMDVAVSEPLTGAGFINGAPSHMLIDANNIYFSNGYGTHYILNWSNDVPDIDLIGSLNYDTASPSLVKYKNTLFNSGGSNNAFFSIDITTPSSPVLGSTALYNNFANSNFGNQFAIDDNLTLWTAGQYGSNVFGLFSSDASSNTLGTATFRKSTEKSGPILIKSGYLYQSKTDGTIDIYNITSASPLFITTIITGSNVSIANMYIMGSYLFVTDNSITSTTLINIYDIADPTNPFIISTIISPAGIQEQVYDFIISGNYLFCIGSVSQKLYIISVENPEYPAPTNGTGSTVNFFGVAGYETISRALCGYPYSHGDGRNLEVF